MAEKSNSSSTWRLEPSLYDKFSMNDIKAQKTKPSEP
jgi:hypothetical protein